MSARRILIIDDEETLTFSMRQSFALEKNGYEIITAGSGEEALGKSEGKAIDAAIADIYLPGINGLELIKKLKEKNPNAVIIVISAYATMDMKDEALENGALYFFEKPFDIKEMKKVLLGTLNLLTPIS